jgi:hypothetical protein
MPKINFSEIRQCTDQDTLNQKIREVIDQFNADDPISISDLLANKHRGGAPLLVELSKLDNEQMLRNQSRFTWKIETLRDEWGNVPNPGDKVCRTHKRPLDRGAGKPIPGSELSQMKIDGSYKDELEYVSEFIVDEKGCIDCTLHDAIHFLNLWGIHYKTKKPLCDKKATSKTVVERADGQMLHVHYHRFKEANKQRYSQLPKRKKVDKRCEENTR